MITIIAWIVFIPAVIINVAWFSIAVYQVVEKRSLEALKQPSNIRDMIAILVVMFVPGVYLFGWV